MKWVAITKKNVKSQADAATDSNMKTRKMVECVFFSMTFLTWQRRDTTLTPALKTFGICAQTPVAGVAQRRSTDHTQCAPRKVESGFPSLGNKSTVNEMAGLGRMGPALAPRCAALEAEEAAEPDHTMSATSSRRILPKQNVAYVVAGGCQCSSGGHPVDGWPQTGELTTNGIHVI